MISTTLEKDAPIFCQTLASQCGHLCPLWGKLRESPRWVLDLGMHVLFQSLCLYNLNTADAPSFWFRLWGSQSQKLGLLPFKEELQRAILRRVSRREPG